jgi:hypothetical protein
LSTGREIAPRCDDYLTPSLPGCVVPYCKQTYTVDTNKSPAASAYYWYMQQVMPYHAGSKRWASLLPYAGPDMPHANGSGGKWTRQQLGRHLRYQFRLERPPVRVIGRVDLVDLVGRL